GLTSVESSAIEIPSLTLPVDNQWTGDYGTRANKTPDKDWGFVTLANGGPSDTVWLDETWTGGLEENIIEITLIGGREVSTDTTININKQVQNLSGFTWTGFTMTLSTLGGNVNVLSSTSPDYSSVVISNNNTPTVTMTYSGGAVVDPDFADFNFSFMIPLTSIWTFTITQTAVPAPASAVLVGAAGLVALRRRR
ncbi:MAG: VPLPA-CTERM sorting domain-containing protein, partial [Phycisphaerales bacterium]|nr:VPLPA-CTERM sorting domain-containing protein [Phycisphaerales bacterium]